MLNKHDSGSKTCCKYYFVYPWGHRHKGYFLTLTSSILTKPSATVMTELNRNTNRACDVTTLGDKYNPAL